MQLSFDKEIKAGLLLFMLLFVRSAVIKKHFALSFI